MPYNDPNPYKDIARKAVHNAVRRGALVRPNECEDCGIGCKPEGHHDDYNEQLEVRWLCLTCHGEQHQKTKPVDFDMQLAAHKAMSMF